MVNVDVDTISVDVMKANSEAFLYNLEVMEYQIKMVTKPFLLEEEGSIFYLETIDVDVTRVILAQTLKALKKESILKADYNVMFTDFKSVTTMSLKPNEDWAINFPDLLVCKLIKEQLNEQSLILKSLVDIVKDKYKKIIFIMEDSKLLERSMMSIGMANIIKSKFVVLWEGNESIIKDEAICEVEHIEAKLEEENVMNSGVALAKALNDTNVNVEEVSTQTLLNGEAASTQTLLNGEAAADNLDLLNLIKSLDVEHNQAKLEEENLMNSDVALAKALNEDINVNVEKVSTRTLLNNKAAADNADLLNLLKFLDMEKINSVDKNGNTQLHLAAQEEKMQIVEHLLACGVEKDVRNNDYKTALHLAAETGNSAIVKMLLKYGFDGNANQINQWTPLHYASRQNHAHVIKILLKFGAEIERKDEDGQTALHLAAQWGHSGVVNLLLKHGANINAQDDDGDTPLHNATQYKEQAVVGILLQNGANINIKNRRNRTSHDEARKQKSYNIIRMFEKHVVITKKYGSN